MQTKQSGQSRLFYLLVRKRMTDNKMRKTAHPAPAMISVEYSLAIFGAKIPETEIEATFEFRLDSIQRPSQFEQEEQRRVSKAAINVSTSVARG